MLDQPFHGLLECAFLGSLYGGIGLCAMKLLGVLDSRMRIYEDVPDHRERQIHGGRHRSERGGIRAQNWQISRPPSWRVTVGTRRQTRSC